MTELTSFRFVRVKLVYVANPEEQCLIDIALSDSSFIVGAWPLYGKWVEWDGSRFAAYPITVAADGQIDFGPGYATYSTNIRERMFEEGEFCTVWGDDERGNGGGKEWTYRVGSVAVLGQVGPHVPPSPIAS